MQSFLYLYVYSYPITSSEKQMPHYTRREEVACRERVERTESA